MNESYITLGQALTESTPAFVPVWKQTVTDTQGRRRLHGAFTGGFSAGYFNTVGSAEGWTPSSFQSSRANRAEVKKQSVEAFMDEEDFNETRVGISRQSGITTGIATATSGGGHVRVTRWEGGWGMRLLVAMGWIPTSTKTSLTTATTARIEEALRKRVLLKNKITLQTDSSTADMDTLGLGCPLPTAAATTTTASRLRSMPSTNTTTALGLSVFEEDEEPDELPSFASLREPHSSSSSSLTTSQTLFVRFSQPLFMASVGFTSPSVPAGFKPHPEKILPLLSSRSSSSAHAKTGSTTVQSSHEQHSQQMRLPADVASRALANGFQPFASDPDKQQRYLLFLQSAVKGGGDEASTNYTNASSNATTTSKEQLEFMKAATLFQPLTAGIATRFTQSKSAHTQVSLTAGLVPPELLQEQSSIALKAEDERKRQMESELNKLKPFRTVEAFTPCRLLCKRFNVAYVDRGDTSSSVGVYLDGQMMDRLVMEQRLTQGKPVSQDTMQSERRENVTTVLERPGMDLFEEIFGYEEESEGEEQDEELALERPKRVYGMALPPPQTTLETLSERASVTPPPAAVSPELTRTSEAPQTVDQMIWVEKQIEPSSSKRGRHGRSRSRSKDHRRRHKHRSRSRSRSKHRHRSRDRSRSRKSKKHSKKSKRKHAHDSRYRSRSRSKSEDRRPTASDFF